MIDTTTPGVYITERGVPVHRQPILITSPEWAFLWELSADAATPIGNLIINLARAESLRLKEAAQ